MKKIGFIGAYDKTDLLINLAKILVTLRYNVLIVDSTINQKARYVVPAINPTRAYITTFEDIDIAVGFNSVEDIKRYIALEGEMPYDIMLVDADTNEKIQGFDLEIANKNYFVTSFDMYSLRRGMEVLSTLTNFIKLEKILFSHSMLKEEDDYLNYLAQDYKIDWEQERVYFPIDNGDLTVLIENQRVQKVKFKKLSMQYKDGLATIINEMFPEIDDSDIRKAIKVIEKGV